MGLLERPNLKLYNIKAIEKPFLAICFTLSSRLVSLLYVCLLDFAQSYVVPPKHFPKRGWGQVFFKPKVDAPLVEPEPGSKDFKEVLKRGSELYPDKVYRIPHHPHEWVIVPYKMSDEIRNIPESKLSFQQGSYNFFMGWHTGVTNHERAVANILKTGVNRIIDVVYAVVQDESYRTVLEKIGDCPGNAGKRFLATFLANSILVARLDDSSKREAGLAYLGLGIGFCIGQFSVSIFSDRYIKRQKAKRGEIKPEDRLPPLVAGAFLVPMGLFWYGWSAEYHTHWTVPILGTGLIGIGILFVFLPVQMYLVDAYTLFAASAIGANTVVRSILGTCIPLAGPALYARLGLG